MRYLLLTSLLAVICVGSSYAAPLSEAEIKKQLMADSQASYPGSCPCPYNTDRGGRSCGRRSAYSKPGGYSPLCYPADISAEMVKEYRERHTQ